MSGHVGSTPVLLDADAVARACGPLQAVEAIESALRAGLDPADDLPRQVVRLRDGQMLLMPSEATGNAADEGATGHVGVKVVTIAGDNPSRGLPRIQASYLLFDSDTLSLRAVLDGTALTTLRTPAVSVAAVRTHLLGGHAPLSVVAVGGGPQATAHVVTLRAAVSPRRPVRSVRYLLRDPARASPDVLATGDVLALGGRDADGALRAADVVVCATAARQPLFDSALLDDRVVVIAVGSHEPDAREVDGALCRRATVIVEDTATAQREAGDVVLAIADHDLDADDLLPMRDVVTGAITLRPDRPVLFKSVGMSWQDLVVAEAVGAAGPN